MCSKREAVKQINRLAALPGFIGMAEAGVIELSSSLMEVSDDDAHCERIISSWVRQNRWMPTPVDLEDIAQSTRRNDGRTVGDASCKACKGTGFRPVWVLVTITRHPNGEVRGSEMAEIGPQVAYDLMPKLADNESQSVGQAVAPCYCEYGRRLYAARISAES